MAGYIGIGGKAKKIKSIYFGVGGKAKKVKKAYIGIGGKAKLWYTSGPPVSRYGLATALNAADHKPCGATTSSYAIFQAGSSASYKPNAYNSSLTKSSPTGASSGTIIFGASISSYAVFLKSGADGFALNNSLAKTDIKTSTYIKPAAQAGSTGTKIIGRNTTYANIYASLTSTLTWGTGNWTIPAASALSGPWSDSSGSSQCRSITFNGYAVFVGGSYTDSDTDYTTYYARVTTVNDSLTIENRTGMPVGFTSVSRSSSNHHCIFAPGYNDSFNWHGTTSGSVAYNTSFTRTILPAAVTVNPGNSTGNWQFYGRAGVTNGGEYNIFAGGTTYGTSPNGIYQSLVHIYDKSLTLTQLDNLSAATNYASICETNGEGAEKVGDYYLFPGGYTGSSATKSSKVEVYQIND